MIYADWIFAPLTDTGRVELVSLSLDQEPKAKDGHRPRGASTNI